MSLRALAAAALLLAALPAQELRTVEVHVTGGAGNSVFLDRGRGEGLLPGMTVRLFPPGQPPIDATIRAVSTNGARADVPPPREVPPTGTRGEVQVPIEQAKPPEPAPAAPPRPTPQHPPWTRREDPRDPGQPLLAPAFGAPADTRPPRLTGSVFGQLDWSRDRGDGRDSEFWLARLGTDFEVTNPFGTGGRVRFAGDLERRGLDLLDEGKAHDDDARIERLSYLHGDEEYAPWRAEVGRFVSQYVPELGLIDGVEGALRFSSGIDVGAGFGGWPLPYPARTTDDDLTAHLFLQWADPDPRGARVLFGYQKSWHDGAPDRDLLLARANVAPSEQWWFSAALRADIYTASDPIKGSGVDLSEAFLQGTWRATPTSGASLSYSHFEWPELKRAEYVLTPPRLVADGRVDRFSAGGWFDLVERVRLDLRGDFWSDQDDSGAGGELRLGFDRVLEEQTWVGVDLFLTEGSTSSGPGFRIGARRPFGEWLVGLGYDWLEYELDTIGGSSTDGTRQSVRASVDWMRGDWQVGLFGQQFFGDGEDSLAIDLFVQFHF